MEILEQAVQYKANHLPIFEKHERLGLDPPDIYPHPDDIIINEATGEVTIDGPVTEEQAGARKAVREHAIKSLPRYLELEAALKKEPTNRELKREFKELKKYYDFLKQDSDRNARHEALRLSRRALRPKPLRGLDLTRLRARWQNEFGRLAPEHLTRHLLFRILAYKVQADRLGDLDAETLKVLRQAAGLERRPPAVSRALAELDQRRFAPPSGTVLVREWDRKSHRVMVMPDGFAFTCPECPSVD